MDYLDCKTLVLGCGNILFGDDGFGPAVVDCLLDNYSLPPHVCVQNAGISVRNLLFTIVLSDRHPGNIIIIDAIDAGKPAGEIFELDIDQLPKIKIDDFSMHQLPTSNLLKELNEFCDIEVKILSAQVQQIPDEVDPGLSKVIRAAIPVACEKIITLIGNFR
ncbi:MAG: hydrogenase maturation protease [Candidatus Marinimicrobia bacterium]|nr:hydrogenase maturation protease [Candidatus Neomarinimicrobiota bacterium]